MGCRYGRWLWWNWLQVQGKSHPNIYILAAPDISCDRTTQMARTKLTLVLLLPTKLHGLSSPTSSHPSIPTNSLETTLRQSFGMLTLWNIQIQFYRTNEWAVMARSFTLSSLIRMVTRPRRLERRHGFWLGLASLPRTWTETTDTVRQTWPVSILCNIYCLIQVTHYSCCRHRLYWRCCYSTGQCNQQKLRHRFWHIEGHGRWVYDWFGRLSWPLTEWRRRCVLGVF
jgi:hypothetical protein